MSYAAIIAWAKNAIAYYEKEPTDFIYPTFLTPEETKAAANAKARRARATRQARLVVRKSVVKKSTDKE